MAKEDAVLGCNIEFELFEVTKQQKDSFKKFLFDKLQYMIDDLIGDFCMEHDLADENGDQIGVAVFDVEELEQ